MLRYGSKNFSKSLATKESSELGRYLSHESADLRQLLCMWMALAVFNVLGIFNSDTFRLDSMKQIGAESFA